MTTDLQARDIVETESGARIHVGNSGLRHGPVDTMARLRRGEVVDLAVIYFRTTPGFETADETHGRLTRRIFTGAGVRHPGSVALAVY